jgi:hypothetical protein
MPLAEVAAGPPVLARMVAAPAAGSPVIEAVHGTPRGGQAAVIL